DATEKETLRADTSLPGFPHERLKLLPRVRANLGLRLRVGPPRALFQGERRHDVKNPQARTIRSGEGQGLLPCRLRGIREVRREENTSGTRRPGPPPHGEHGARCRGE